MVPLASHLPSQNASEMLTLHPSCPRIRMSHHFDSYVSYPLHLPLNPPKLTLLQGLHTAPWISWQFCIPKNAPTVITHQNARRLGMLIGNLEVQPSSNLHFCNRMGSNHEGMLLNWGCRLMAAMETSTIELHLFVPMLVWLQALSPLLWLHFCFVFVLDLLLVAFNQILPTQLLHQKYQHTVNGSWMVNESWDSLLLVHSQLLAVASFLSSSATGLHFLDWALLTKKLTNGP